MLSVQCLVLFSVPSAKRPATLSPTRIIIQDHVFYCSAIITFVKTKNSSDMIRNRNELFIRFSVVFFSLHTRSISATAKVMRIV